MSKKISSKVSGSIVLAGLIIASASLAGCNSQASFSKNAIAGTPPASDTHALVDTTPSPAPATPAAASLECPNTALGETALDCPWGFYARTLQADAARGFTPAQMEKALKEVVPMLTQQIHRDRARTDWLQLWGHSINFDENAHGIVVDPAIIDAIMDLANVGARQERIVHAGVEHTYGYLLSTLQTPYGYKRARWVSSDIVNGFKLMPGSIGPTPTYGTLFSNLTYFAGSIALRDQKDELKIIQSEADGVSPSIKHYPYGRLEITRVEEVITAPRAVTLRTDFVKFPNQPANPTANTNTYLLVYSIYDSADPVTPVKLISAFPVSTGSMTMTTTSGLGENVPVQTRYNAYVAGITAPATPLTGTKRVIAPEAPAASN